MTAKKSSRLKAIAGTSRADRDTEIQVDMPLVDVVPEPPDWLPNIHAVKEWDRLARILTENKMLTEGGLSALAVLCSIHGKIVQLCKAGESPTGHMLAQYRGYINDFGLTPVSQGKVTPNGSEKPKANAFSRNGKRTA
ncbi:MAG: hypothetical protein V4501_12300 [Pseudomonadota bacterium]